MYQQYYRLTDMPFKVGPDPKFLWLGARHKEAYDILRYGVLESQGFVVITGEPGIGKSTLLNAAIAEFEDKARFVKIGDPALDGMDFFNLVADALAMGRDFQSKGQFLIQMADFIQKAGSRKVVLIIDEAQRVTLDVLEQIRLLFNADAPEGAFSCIFAGQPEFLEILRQNRALRQKIFFNFTIQPLTPADTGNYIQHRLKVAGGREPIFTPAAIEEIFKASEGNPRLINIVCNQALLSGYALNQNEIGPDLIKESSERTLVSPLSSNQTASDAQPTTALTVPPAPSRAAKKARTPFITPSRRKAFIIATLSLAATGLAIFLYNYTWLSFPQASIENKAVYRSKTPSPDTAPGPANPINQAQIVEVPVREKEEDPQMKELRANLMKLESELKKLQGERKIAEGALKARLDAISSQKEEAESRLGREVERSIQLFEELKTARERVAQLQSAGEEKEKQLDQAQQKYRSLENSQAEENAAQGQADIEKLIKEVDNTKKADPPDPGNIIDYVIKKKSQ